MEPAHFRRIVVQRRYGRSGLGTAIGFPRPGACSWLDVSPATAAPAQSIKTNTIADISNPIVHVRTVETPPAAALRAACVHERYSDQQGPASGQTLDLNEGQHCRQDDRLVATCWP